MSLLSKYREKLVVRLTRLEPDKLNSFWGSLREHLSKIQRPKNI